MAEGLAVFTQEDVQRLSETVRGFESMLRELRTMTRQQLPEGGGGAVKLGKLKEDLASGGNAKGVLLVDNGSGALVEETSDPSQYRTFIDRLDDGTLPGIAGTAGRRCYVAPDSAGSSAWMVIQVLRSCDE